MEAAAPTRSRQSLRRLSRDYADLLALPREPAWDVVIVGSGYGGAMAASELAGLQEGGRPLRLCVLERGREYAPGMFPSRMEELPAHVRVHRTSTDESIGRAEGLLDVRIGPDVSAIVGNGLGGGSLINAGVMEEPDFTSCRLPASLRGALEPFALAGVKAALGANTGLRDTPLPKRDALESLARQARLPFRHADITVQTGNGTADRPACTLCGDCMTGCNVGAKKSLDTTLLREAREKRVEIFTGCSVLRVQRAAGGDWELETVFTNEAVRLRHAPAMIRARKVILAAGTLGSTEILLRSRSPALRLSDRLGTRFSCNGDNLVALYDGPAPARPGGQEHQRLDRRGVGPTITGVAQIEGALLQEFAVPAPIRRLFDETVTTTDLLHGLTERPAGARDGRDSMAVDPEKMERTLLLGVIGHDEAAGRIVLNHVDMDPRHRHIEGRVGVEWESVRASPLMDYTWRRANEAFRAGGDGATVLPNPLWRPLPASVDALVAGKRGPVLTVHPLGGCGMGASVQEGVVDHRGRVFDAAGTLAGPFHEGLFVLDGSILPGSVGVNPALTIAAIARHAVRELVAEHPHWQPGAACDTLPPRPRLRFPAECTPPRPPVATEAELMERLSGSVGEWWVEMTLCYRPVAVRELTTRARRHLQLDPGRSFLRVYRGGEAARCEVMTLRESERDQLAEHIAQLHGTLALSEPAGGAALAHALRAGAAWVTNRGTRELWDRWILGQNKGARLTAQRFLNSAARAGEMRCFDYALSLGATLRSRNPPLARQLAAGRTLSGSKRLTYGNLANPWRQLTEMKLEGFPGTPCATLAVDGRFMARQGVPLMRITKQENQVVALAECASLGLAWLRTLVSVHTWSFRAPDPAPEWTPQLRPGPVRELPPPHVHVLHYDVQFPLRPAEVLLTNYANPGRPPIALIHGYSASGSTFTHPAIPEPLARHLWRGGHDVWVVDLRTSAALPTAKLPWRFEDAAFVDIPAAVAKIRALTGRRVNVLAHCIGAVQLSMALLADRGALERWERADGSAPWRRAARVRPLLKHLPDNIGRIVLSQKGPMLAYSDANVMRAYFLRALRRAILPQDYQFRSPGTQTAGGSLMDRLFSTLPYPDEEFLLENPFLPPWQRAAWAGFRHRMDALYARDFSLGNIAPQTLAAIEDLFGPLHLDTVAQAIHFARLNTITDASGEPFDTSAARLKKRWPGNGTMGLHGEKNGLVDVHSLHVLRQQMDFAGVPFEEKVIERYGHQDCLIGRDAARDVFPHVVRFLA